MTAVIKSVHGKSEPSGQCTGARRRLLRNMLTKTSVDFSDRGFYLESAASRRHLETYAQAFIDGAVAQVAYGHDIHEVLLKQDVDSRGFAYEGAAFSAAMMDSLHIYAGRNVRVLNAGPGIAFRHLINVGVGWAMGKTHFPAGFFSTPDPLLRWLAYDGAGFQRCFFRPESVNDVLARLARGRSRDRIVAQGVGRSLWFIDAGNIDRIRSRVNSAPDNIRGDVWSGVGLAAAYAGDAAPVNSTHLLEAAEKWTSNLGQGVIFGSAARDAHGHVPESTTTLARELLKATPATAAAWADEAALGLRTHRTGPNEYLAWQHRLQDLANHRLKAQTGGAR